MSARATRTGAHRLPMVAGAALALVLAAGCGQANQATRANQAGQTGPTSPASVADTPPTAPTESTAPAESAEPAAPADPGATSETRASTLADTESGTPENPEDTFTTSATRGGSAPGGGDLLPVAVRTGTHDDITRVVVEFTGETSPGWSAAYVQEAIEQGRGEPIDVEGEAILSVSIRGLLMPESEAQVRAMLSGPITPQDPKVADLHLDPAFEGQAVAHIGLDQQYPYVVTTLADPQRVVIDIRTGTGTGTGTR